ncbi:hypothetical protein Cpir12675_006157 [Ceratocystis pirilliformis]|uniref:F-box domain-containing protein n=1 Tax=Ceratocystis pirilliformis TaxID=259994 RepID=A0ABR3YMB1_9PEZI
MNHQFSVGQDQQQQQQQQQQQPDEGFYEQQQHQQQQDHVLQLQQQLQLQLQLQNSLQIQPQSQSQSQRSGPDDKFGLLLLRRGDDDKLAGGDINSLVSLQLQAIQTLPLEIQKKFAMELLQGLPTSSVAEIVYSLSPRLYIDFVQYLPAEVCLKILSFLDVRSVIRFSCACRSWYHLSLDSRLWRQLYHLEGWSISQSELVRLERWANSSQLNSSSIDFQFSSKATHRDHDVEMLDSHTPTSAIAPNGHSAPGGTASASNISTDTVMVEAKAASSSPSSKSASRLTSPVTPARSRGRHEDPDFEYLDRPTVPQSNEIPQLSLWSFNRYNDQFRINWKYIYVMRHRLEKNWSHGRFLNFQFPHPKHPEESHRECVYSLQFSKYHMVSGSRDRTIRIWDMRTRRLVRPPLIGHAGSVLCLQYDSSPEEDVIISGSSDSDVIVWRFSTGEMIQKLTAAHRESVLNLRFNKNVLVTCSKDMTIKVFNRHPLKYGDAGYGPGDPELLSKVPITVKRYGYENGPADYMPIKPPYETVCTLTGHTAPVNSVQIYDKEVVSASGDRLIKIWNWEKGQCVRTVQGHTKGIACVQYDGRRVVSGSSDNEIKIFDSRTGAVVARLSSHRHLVRTVQAGFADLPYSEVEDEREARLVDLEFDRAVAEGLVDDPSRPHQRERNRSMVPGSRRPDQLLSRGAKLPPGGGGGPHARIVSGSYDETIVVWKRNHDEIWQDSLTLRQEEAILNAQMLEAQRHSPHQPLPPRTMSQWQEHCNHILSLGSVDLHATLVKRPALLLLVNIFQGLIDRVSHPDSRQHLRTQLDISLNKYVQAVQVHESRRSTASNSKSAASVSASPATFALDSIMNPARGAASLAAAPGSLPTGNGMPNFEIDPVRGPPVSMRQITHRLDLGTARIFKVQFDATRIIACTQKPTIVGWDFCCDDRELKALERLFLPIL